jgi:hypothetical protein
MRDPDLIGRAQRAAMELERAWDRWRTMHGLGREPMPAVSSYVGYSLEEPWGQPRVVFGIEAREAEQLAALLDRHDCAGPVYAGLSAMPGARTEESTDYLGSPAERKRVVVPSQSQGGVAEREAAWREATWREAAVREPVMEQASPEPHLLAGVPRQQAAGEPLADADETAVAEVAEPYDEDEPDLLEDEDPGDDEDKAPLASFRPPAEPGPQASDGEEAQEDEADQAADEPEEPVEADHGSPLWRRQGRAARGHGPSRQKRSGGAARGGNGR